MLLWRRVRALWHLAWIRSMLHWRYPRRAVPGVSPAARVVGAGGATDSVGGKDISRCFPLVWPGGRFPRSRTTCEGLTTVRTFSPKDSDITRQWHVIDATDVVLG